MIEVFISHSSQDEKLADALIAFLREALSLKPSQIRCTTIAGYGLPAGANTEVHLRAEILETTYFLALITPTSLKSPWVLIELGARWASEKPLMPLLAKGAAANSLKGPIASLNALHCNSEADMQQLVSQIARELGDEPPQPAVYRRALTQLIRIAAPETSPFNPILAKIMDAS